MKILDLNDIGKIKSTLLLLFKFLDHWHQYPNIINDAFVLKAD